MLSASNVRQPPNSSSNPSLADVVEWSFVSIKVNHHQSTAPSNEQCRQPWRKLMGGLVFSLQVLSFPPQNACIVEIPIQSANDLMVTDVPRVYKRQHLLA